jgi:tetratricopeptide (TPR) repeat protein
MPLSQSSAETRRGEAGPVRAASGIPDRDARSERAEALYRLGLLQADPSSGLRDYRAARDTFTRLLSEYPRSRWDAEARAWQATLTDLLMREDEARRYSQRVQRLEEDSKRIKTNLEWLKQTDLDRTR